MTDSKTAARTITRGIRNHNPGNIRKGDPWQGLSPVQDDRDFCVFISPKWGIRALARLLIAYQDRYDLNTVRGIVSRWAPPTENNTGAYIKAVTDHASDDALVGPDEVINLHQYPVLAALVRAIIRHENGCQPYSQAEIDEGLKLAGVVPPAKPAVTGGHVFATGGQIGAAATGLAAAATSPEIRAAVESTGIQWLIGGFALLALAGTAWLVWQRIAQAKLEA